MESRSSSNADTDHRPGSPFSSSNDTTEASSAGTTMKGQDIHFTTDQTLGVNHSVPEAFMDVAPQDVSLSADLTNLRNDEINLNQSERRASERMFPKEARIPSEKTRALSEQSSEHDSMALSSHPVSLVIPGVSEKLPMAEFTSHESMSPLNLQKSESGIAIQSASLTSKESIVHGAAAKVPQRSGAQGYTVCDAIVPSAETQWKESSESDYVAISSRRQVLGDTTSEGKALTISLLPGQESTVTSRLRTNESVMEVPAASPNAERNTHSDGSSMFQSADVHSTILLRKSGVPSQLVPLPDPEQVAEPVVCHPNASHDTSMLDCELPLSALPARISISELAGQTNESKPKLVLNDSVSMSIEETPFKRKRKQGVRSPVLMTLSRFEPLLDPLSSAPTSLSARAIMIHGLNFSMLRKFRALDNQVKPKYSAHSSAKLNVDDVEEGAREPLRKKAKRQKDPAIGDRGTAKSAPQVGKRKRPRAELPPEGTAVRDMTTPKDEATAKKTCFESVDLTKILSKEDCFFLGEYFWIFTLAQLEYVLILPPIDGVDLPEKHRDAESFLRELSKCLVLERRKTTDKKSTEHNTNGYSGEKPEHIHDDAKEQMILNPNESTTSEEVCETVGEASLDVGIHQNSAHGSAAKAMATSTLQPGSDPSVCLAALADDIVNEPEPKSGQEDEELLSVAAVAVNFDMRGRTHAIEPEISVEKPILHTKGTSLRLESQPRSPSIHVDNSVLSQTVHRGDNQEVFTIPSVETTSKAAVFGAASDDSANSTTAELSKHDDAAVLAADVVSNAGFPENTGNVRGVGAIPAQGDLSKSEEKCKSEFKSLENGFDEAETLLRKWRQQISDWKAERKAVENDGSESAKSQFALDGPVKVLFPDQTRNFLKTISIGTVYEFLAVRKTELSSFTTAMFYWRKCCNLPEIKRYTLARYIAGIAQRVETAICSVPAADSFARKWMGGALCSLTGAAKEFVVDECKCDDAELFIEARTKDWSNRLVKWRKATKKSDLKGSGKIAMVSGWKTSVKEARDAEQGNGRVLSESEILDVARTNEEEVVAPVVKSSKRAEKPTRTKKARHETDAKTTEIEDGRLHSSEYLRSMLSEEIAVILASAGIQNTKHLIDASKAQSSPLILAIEKYRSRTTSGPVIKSSCIRMAYHWIERLKRGPEDTEAARKIGNSAAKTPNTYKHRKRNRPVVKNSSKGVDENQDPLCSLSTTARNFLESIDIKNAEEFLSVRSTLLAQSYIAWRAKTGMPPLKGDGPHTTVSGWKGSVRKAAEICGMHELAAIQPLDRIVPAKNRESSQLPFPSPLPQPEPSIRFPKAEIPQIVPDNFSDPDVLNGKSRQEIAVQNTDDPQVLYHFELTLRVSESNRERKALFLAYKQCTRRKSSSIAVKTTYIDEIPVMNSVSLDSSETASKSTLLRGEPFSSKLSGCGLIEVGRYGVMPFPVPDIQNRLNDMIKRFLSCRNIADIPGLIKVQAMAISQSESGSSSQNSSFANVLTFMNRSGSSRLLLNVAEPMEAGQVLELRFDDTAKSGVQEKECFDLSSATVRLDIARFIAVLSRKDLKAVVANVSRLLDELMREMFLEQRVSTKTDLRAEKRVEHLVSRRRLHWLGTLFLPRLVDLYESDQNKNEMNVVSSEIRRVSMGAELLHHLISSPAISDGRSPLEEIKIEVASEILTDVQLLHTELDISQWCPLAIDLLLQCVELASDHVVVGPADSFSAQQALVDQFRRCVRDSVAVILPGHPDRQSLAIKCNQSKPHEIDKAPNWMGLFWKGDAKFPPATVARLASFQAYHDSMELVGEPLFGDIVTEALRQEGSKETISVVKVSFPWTSSCTFRNWEETVAAKVPLDKGWYIRNQVLAVVDSVASARCLKWTQHFDRPNEQIYSYRCLADAARELVAGDAHIDICDCLDQTKPCLSPSMRSESYSEESSGQVHPKSLPLFLALVWPTLRSTYGWKLVAGDLPSDIKYVSPVDHSYKSDAERRIGQLKAEQARKREHIEQRLLDVGLGSITKLSKRLFVMSAEEGVIASKERTAFDAINLFVQSVLSEIGAEDNQESQKRMIDIGEALKLYFDGARKLVSFGGEAVSDSDSNSCEYLMRMLLVLPSILRQASLSPRQLEDTMGTIKDLSNFLSLHHEILFDKQNHPCSEEYENGDEEKTSFLVPRIRHAMIRSQTENRNSEAAQSTDCVDVIRELVLSDDLRDLTEYTATTLGQMIPCRANASDIAKKNRKHVVVGYPGIMCRHCMGFNAEGRYFFSSVGSLGTAANIVLPHLNRCPRVPDEIKAKLGSLKARHSDDLRNAVFGAQSRYFRRLWKRLFSSGTAIASGEVFAVSPDVPQVGEQSVDTATHCVEIGMTPPPDFNSHVALLHYLQTTSPWKEKRDLTSCFDLYYQCLKYGGELYQNTRMPKNFTSEWILAKVPAPQPLKLRKKYSVG